MKFTDGFESAKIKASIYLKDHKNLNKLQFLLDQKIEKSKEKIVEALIDIHILMRLLTAYGKDEYREISSKTMIVIVAALIYLLNPMDVIPDFLATIGFVDDLTILAYVIKTFKDEINRFVAWEMERKDHKQQTDIKEPMDSKHAKA